MSVDGLNGFGVFCSSAYPAGTGRTGPAATTESAAAEGIETEPSASTGTGVPSISRKNAPGRAGAPHVTVSGYRADVTLMPALPEALADGEAAIVSESKRTSKPP